MTIHYREENYWLSEELEYEVQDLFSIKEFNNFFIEKNPQGTSVLKLYFLEKDINPFSSEIKKLGLKYISDKKMIEMDWLEEWINTLDAFELTEGIWVDPFPKRELLEIDNAKKVFKIIPGTAFGTGLHATTQLASDLIMKCEVDNKKVIDVGCGTGILALLADYMGAKELTCLDDDPMAIVKTDEIFLMNNVNPKQCETSDLLEKYTSGKVDLIIANIICEVLVMLLDDPKLKMITHSKTKIVFSGISDVKKPIMLAEFSKRGIVVDECREKNGWNAFLFSL